MRVEHLIGFVILGVGLGACGDGSTPCDALDENSCEEGQICRVDARGSHCRSAGRLGVALPQALEPCDHDMPCSTGFICLSYACQDGQLAFAQRARDIRDNGCLPLCDAPAPYDPDGTGEKCIELDPSLSTQDYGLALSLSLVQAACQP